MAYATCRCLRQPLLMVEKPRKRGLFHSLRFKLLLVSLSLLSLPWAGYQYIQETEIFLRQARERVLLDTAQSIATLLHNRDDLFNLIGDNSSSAPDSSLYAHRLETPVQLDGYAADWGYLLPLARTVAAAPVDQSQQQTPTPSLSFDYLIGLDDRYLFLLIRVRDDHIVYQDPGSGNLEAGDHLQIFLENPEGLLARYLISSPAPGWVTGSHMPDGWEAGDPVVIDNRIRGEWQETSDGYNIELRLPVSMLGSRLSLAVADVDDPLSREITQRLTTSSTDRTEALGILVTPSTDIERIIRNLEHEDVRIWVLDRLGRVLAQRGHLKKPALESNLESSSPPRSALTQALFRLVLQQPTDEFMDEFAHATQRHGREIDAALRTTPETSRRTTPDGKAVIISAAYPIHAAGEVQGVVLVEQTTNAILSLQNQALERLFHIVLLAFGGTSLLLLGFSSLLTGRILRLRNRIESAVNAEGRIHARLIAAGAKDEFGDLERSFSGVLDRLAEYNRYLETVASRLAHEMRTPLTMVAGSLENLEMVTAEAHQQTYIARARNGVERLTNILNQMREATRLEQALQRTEKEAFDLVPFLNMAHANYRAIYPEIEFGLRLPQPPLTVHGAAELIVQALDKLVSNAVDFHSQGTQIEFQLRRSNTMAVLSVSNLGPTLPDAMSKELFGSMVSIRPTAGAEPHLGLGLYLVQIICEYHGGKAIAENLKAQQGVKFSMLLPLV